MHEVLKLYPGLIIIRQKPSAHGSTATIKPVIPQSEVHSLELILDPLKSNGTLENPGDCVVLRCTREARLRLEINSKPGFDNARGSVTVEYLTSKQKNQLSGNYNQSVVTASLDIMGHLAVIGDVRVRDAQWIAGPSSPQAIEGLQITAKNADTLGVYLRDADTGQVAQPREFLGTRGQRRALKGIDIWLSNHNKRKELFVEAQFRDAGLVTGRGDFIILRGEDGSDPLMGLKVDLRNLEPAFEPTHEKKSTAKGSGRVKIFRE